MQQPETAIVRKLVLSTQDRLLRQITITKQRLTIGRRPYNDIALDHLTVSGEHAVLHTGNGDCVIHDLKSRNGTLVNGEPIEQRLLVDGDRIDVGIYRLRYVVERISVDPDTPGARDCGPAQLRMLGGGGASGTVVRLDRPITSIGNAGGAVAVVARRRNGYHITHLEGPSCPLVNGAPIGLIAHPLDDGDLIELAGTIYRFELGPP